MAWNTIKAWAELIKIGNVGQLRKTIDAFFRDNIVGVFKEEGLFAFLKTPRAIGEIASEFQYTDVPCLTKVLDAFLTDRVIQKTKDSRFRLGKNLDATGIIPTVFEEALVDLFKSYAKALPSRLRGTFLDFSSGFNLFNWDDALTSRMYTQIRKSAFTYAENIYRAGALLDVGCGNGYATTAIWYEFFRRNLSHTASPIKIVGIDPDDTLLRIAREEFGRRATMFTKLTVEQIEKYEKIFPQFQVGDALSIPFEDEAFDVVYTSQVLHWTDARVAIQEMLRVTKKGGKVLGTENLYPAANKYNDLYFQVVKGAQGFFYRKDLIRWGKEGGAKTVKIATPISVFLMEK